MKRQPPDRALSPANRRSELALATLAFAALTLALTFPQALYLTARVGTHYDALFSVWRLAWVAHQLRADPQHLFDANIFHPEPGTLAYSDAMLLLGAAGAPAMWAGVPPVLVYNMLVLLAFVAAGVGMFVLGRELGGSRAGAACAGIFFAFQPYRFAHFSHLELLWTCWIPLAAWALLRMMRSGRLRDGVATGVFLGLQAWSCLYYALFVCTFLPLVAAGAALGRARAITCRHVIAAAAGAVCFAVMVAPYSLPYLRSGLAARLRGVEDVTRWSAGLTEYGAAQIGHWWYPGAPPTVDAFEGVLFPGALAIALSIYALLVGRPRRLAVLCAAIALVAFDLSLGVNGFSYGLLHTWLAPYRSLRVPARFFVIVSAALAALTCMAVTHIRQTWARGRYMALATVALMVVESASMPLPLSEVPAVPPRLYEWLAGQPAAPVFEWPTPRPDQLGFTQEPRYMYQSIAHWKPLLNGYSGNSPESYIAMLHSTQNFPDRYSVVFLRRMGVRYVVLHSFPDADRYARVRAELDQAGAFQLQLSESEGSEEFAMYVLHRNEQ